jgi:predicted AlkP superfamily phosphohydrolase/phosphomutase
VLHRPVIALGLDAFEPTLLEQWVDAGELPVLAGLFREGTYVRQSNYALNRTENSWLTLLQGCAPEDSEEWGHQDYLAGEYRVVERAAYNFAKYPPFYAQSGRRVAVFDMPLTGLVDGVDGVQLLGWGTEVNQILRASSPPGLMDDLIARHGRHPLYDTVNQAADGAEVLSYRMPCLYDAASMRDVRDKLIDATRRRTAIIAELIAQERWDLLVAVYAEIHTAGHLLWHVGRDHRVTSDIGVDYLLEVAREIDRSLGELMPLMPDDADLVVFSPHGMQANSIDINSMLFLPELVYRWSSGAAAISGDSEAVLPQPLDSSFDHWSDAVRQLRTPHGEQVLTSTELREEGDDPLDWDPANWYRPLWPTMRAFVLPGYSEGLIRINVAGRDGPGGIAVHDYEAVCAELTDIALALVDARTGQPLADRVLRVRSDPFAVGKPDAPADLIVVWREDCDADVVEHPRYGRIGPVPYFRTGGHSTAGFFLGRGKRFAPGLRLSGLPTEDATATFFAMLGVDQPAHAKGKPIGALPVLA